MKIQMIAFDADDTLWHNEILYRQARQQFVELLVAKKDGDDLGRCLDRVEIGNLSLYGYGIKSFALSMVQTAAEVFQGEVDGIQIRQVLAIIERMLQSPVQLFEHSEQVLQHLYGKVPLMLITKGDLFEQERKVNRSGLRNYFTHIEVVGDKTVETYRSLLARHHCEPEGFLMVGNSLRSDILPIVQLGGKAVYIPYEMTWSHEHVEESELAGMDFIQVNHMGELPALLNGWL